MSFQPDELQEILSIYKAETEEHLQNLNEGLLRLEKAPRRTETLEEIFREARGQDALLVACHPHHTDHEIHDTLYFWNHRKKYASYFDAWEVANRTDLFSVVSLSNYPILANGDFHKANHLYSWKTLLPCLKNVEAVKECIRDNRGVAITMFRNGTARE